MKTLLALIVSLGLCSAAFAQDTNAVIKSSVISFAQLTATNRNLTIAAYPSYAPGIVVNGKKDPFGMGVAFLTPVSTIDALQANPIAQHTFVLLRLDYMAHQAYATTGTVGVKGDVQLWGHNFTGFGYAGANVPFSGFGVHNGDLGAVTGVGLYTDIYRFTHGALGLQLSAEKWTQFSGEVFHGGPVLNISF